MTQRLAGRAAIVTGASRGLGRATALALAAEGVAVAVVARTEEQWDERLPGTIGDTVAAVESVGGRAVAIRADLLERGTSRASSPRPATRWGRSPSWSATRRSPRRVVRRDPVSPRKQLPQCGSAATPDADWPGFLQVPCRHIAGTSRSGRSPRMS